MNFKKLTAVALASVFTLGASFSMQPKTSAAYSSSIASSAKEIDKDNMSVAIDAIKREMEKNNELKEKIDDLKKENKNLKKELESKATSFLGVVGNFIKFVVGAVVFAVAVDVANDLEAGEFVVDKTKSGIGYIKSFVNDNIVSRFTKPSTGDGLYN